jgi:hypothetical protein
MTRDSRSTSCLILVLLALLTLVGKVAPGQELRLEYEGVFAPPHYPASGPRYGYGMKGMAYSPDCVGNSDPSPDDGYPGCLLATSHVHFDVAGIFDIPAPQRVAGEDRTQAFWGRQLGHAVPVVEFFDPSGGLRQQLDEQPDWKARDIPGVELVGEDLISTCGHDWYNVAGVDHDSHCWAKLRPDGTITDAVGGYNLGPKRDPKKVFYADKLSHYIGVIGQRFADEHLDAGGRKLCFSGMQRRGGGGPGRSQGPTIYAHDCSRPKVEPPGWLDATLLLFYRPQYPVSVAKSDFPEYSPDNKCYDGVWIEVGESRGALFACRQGGPIWWYGFADPWQDPGASGQLINHRNGCYWNKGEPRRSDGRACGEEFTSYGPPIPCYEKGEAGECTRGLKNRCGGGKGIHGVFEEDPQFRARLLWYPEEGLADVLGGARKPWQVPFEVLVDHPHELWPACAGAFGGLALDSQRGKLYVAQIMRGEFPVIHVYGLASGQLGRGAP